MSELEDLLKRVRTKRAEQERLAKAVDALIKQATDRGVADKAVRVASVLGIKDKNDTHYKSPPLLVIFEFSPERIGVFYNDKLVFAYQHKHVTTYRPDIEGWEKALDENYDSVEEKEKERLKNMEDEAIRQFKEDWGLEVAEYDFLPWDAANFTYKGIPEKKEPTPFGPKYAYAHRT